MQEPYFSEKQLKREGIIGQEIQMYQDNPDWRLYFGLIDSLFVKHQLKLILQAQSNLLVKLRKIYYMNVMKHFIIRAICYYLLWVQLIRETMDLVRENQAEKDYKTSQKLCVHLKRNQMR